MSRLSYASNHAVAPVTLEAIRSRHPLALQAVAYQPGRYEIGHGCRWGPYPGLRISPVQAEDLFRSDIAYVEGRIRTWFSCPMRDGAYQALISYFFDVGAREPFAEDAVSLFANGGEKEFFRTLPGASIGRVSELISGEPHASLSASTPPNRQKKSPAMVVMAGLGVGPWLSRS